MARNSTNNIVYCGALDPAKDIISFKTKAEIEAIPIANRSENVTYRVIDPNGKNTDWRWDASEGDYQNTSSSIPAGSITDADISPTAQIDATKIADGSVSNAEFQALDGVTSGIQGQIDTINTGISNKADKTITISTSGALQGGGDLSANRTLSIQDASTTQKGATQLSNLYNGASQVLATTEKALSDGLATKVGKTGNETIADIKTFSSSPIVPTAPAGDSSAKASNTEFVQGELANRVKTPASYTAGNLVKYNSTTNELEDAGSTAQDLIDLQESFINLPAYQDFTNVTGTSLTLTTNSNVFLLDGTPAPETITNANLIITNRAVAVLTSDPSQYPRTSAFTSIKLVSSIITATNSSATVTLSGVPRTADKDNIRIYFELRYKIKNAPQLYDGFPDNVRLKLSSLDSEGLATDDELATKLSKTIAGEISALTEKTTLASNDAFLIEDSASSNAKKYLKYSTILTQIADTTKTTVTKYVNDLTGSDTNDGNTEFTAYKTIEKAWTDITPSGQVKVLGAATYNVNHTFANTKTSIKTILEGGTKITGTIGFVAGNNSMQFIGGKVQATINDASSGTQYWGGVDVSGSTFNFSGGGYKQITNSSSTPTAINLSGSIAGTLEINNVIGGVIPVTSNALWITMYRNSIVSKLGTTGTVVDANNMYANAVVISQLVLDNLPADGYYILNFANPVIAGITVGKGDIIYKTGSTRLRVYEFANAPASFAVVNAGNVSQRDTYIKIGDGWVIPATTEALAGKQPLDAIGADIASASTVNLDTATGNYVNITGSSTINVITLSAGKRVVARFTGTAVLTQSSNLIIPNGGANITTAAGDTAEFIGEAGGVVRCTDYQRASGLAVSFSSSFNSVQIQTQAPASIPTASSGYVTLGAGTDKIFRSVDSSGNVGIYTRQGDLFDTQKLIFQNGTTFTAAQNYPQIFRDSTTDKLMMSRKIASDPYYVEECNNPKIYALTGSSFNFNNTTYMGDDYNGVTIATIDGMTLSNKPRNIINASWRIRTVIDKSYNGTHITKEQYASTDGGYVFMRSAYDTIANINSTLAAAPWIAMARDYIDDNETVAPYLINGKTVYQRAFSITTPVVGGSSMILITSGISDVVNVFGPITRSNGHKYPFAMVGANSAHPFPVYKDTNNSAMTLYPEFVSTEFNNRPAEFVAQYLKV